MLHNPHRQVPSLESFTAWLETMPPDGTYEWEPAGYCACAQYAKARRCFKQWREAWNGIRGLVRPEAMTDDEAATVSMWMKLNRLAGEPRADELDRRRYGDLLKKVRTAS